ncbi:MAG: hypothetical protein ACP5L3_05995 [Caldisericum sp.]
MNKIEKNSKRRKRIIKINMSESSKVMSNNKEEKYNQKLGIFSKKY